jgi:hypothetical protein
MVEVGIDTAISFFSSLHLFSITDSIASAAEYMRSSRL